MKIVEHAIPRRNIVNLKSHSDEFMIKAVLVVSIRHVHAIGKAANNSRML